MIKEENTRLKYLALHAVDKKAKQIANLTAKNRNINKVQNLLASFTRELETARSQNWSNNDIRLYAYYPYPRLTLRKIIYYLKQHMKRLEFAKFLAGRKVAEMMMPKAKANYMKVRNQ
jgi:flagellin-specific chaperone FliS